MNQLFKSKNFHISLLVAIGLVGLYSVLYGQMQIGGKDWVDTFRRGAYGDFTFVTTPYWSLFLSFLPSRLFEPMGYVVWIGLGILLVLVTSQYFESPIPGILLSYQLNWVLFYGQIDPYILSGIGLGHFSIIHSNPILLGLAIILITIKPQVGILVAIYFFWLSPDKLKTLVTVLAIILLSMIIWPGWPETYLFEKLLTFLDRPENLWANASLNLPIWIGVPLSIIGLLLPLNKKQKIQGLIATGLVISPYSTIYSQLSLLCLGLPKFFYLFALAPWIIAIILGPFGHWKWASIFPLSVLIYLYQAAYKDKIISFFEDLFVKDDVPSH